MAKRCRDPDCVVLAADLQVKLRQVKAERDAAIDRHNRLVEETARLRRERNGLREVAEQAWNVIELARRWWGTFDYRRHGEIVDKLCAAKAALDEALEGKEGRRERGMAETSRDRAD